MRNVYITLLLLLTACTKVDSGVMEFTIKEGHHYCTHDIYRSCGSHIGFEFYVDDTWYYEAQQPGINKVIGIADGCDHMKHSVRLGWMCTEGILHSYIYCYNGGDHVAKKLAYLFTGWHTGNVDIFDSYYMVTVDGVSDTVNRKCNHMERHLLWPYFGGKDTAPHDININIKLI